MKTTTHDSDGPTDVAAAELAHARECLDRGDVVRVAIPRVGVVLCTTLADVRSAQAGKIPRTARRLDGRVR